MSVDTLATIHTCGAMLKNLGMHHQSQVMPYNFHISFVDAVGKVDMGPETTC